MIEKNFITRSEWNKHIHGNWRVSHAIWPHLRNYVPGWGYSQAEIDAFFEGEDGGKKQVHWDRITNKPATFAPSAHTLASHSTKAHSELSDAPADAHHPQSHASAHEVGGGDLLAFADITGFSTYLDQAVKEASNVEFGMVTAPVFRATGTGATPDAIVGLYPYGTSDSSYVQWRDSATSLEWSVGTVSHQASWAVRRESGTPGNMLIVDRATGKVMATVELDTPKLTINGGFYIDTLAANNRVDDSDKWGGNAFADYMNQAVKTTSNVDFLMVTAPVLRATGTVAYPDAIVRFQPYGVNDESYVKYLDSTGSQRWSVGTPSHQASWAIRRESGTPGNVVIVEPGGRVLIPTEVDTAKLTIGSYYIDTLVANNRVYDSARLGGTVAASYALASQLHAETHTLVSHTSRDHHNLTGLGDDDHSIYYNAARHTKAVHTTLGLMPYTGGTFTGVVLMNASAKLEARDHGTFSIDEVVNVCYGTSTPPLPNTTTHGTIFLKYTA